MSSSGSASMDFSTARTSAPRSQSSTFLTLNVREFRHSSSGEKHDYEEMGHIGSGGNGSCFLLKRKSDQKLRVCKVTQRLKFGKSLGYDDNPPEAAILKSLPRHPRIIELRDIVIQPKHIQLYFPFCSDGDLNALIHRHAKYGPDVPDTFIWHAFIQLTEAVAYLHTGLNKNRNPYLPRNWPTIIHGDIKPGNIFLGPPDPDSKDILCRHYPSLILGDFGLSGFVPSNSYGTLNYSAPEMKRTHKSDVWSIGATIHALALNGREPGLPFPDYIPATLENILCWFKNPANRRPFDLEEQFGWRLHDCVHRALDFNPRTRISSYDLHYMVLDYFQCSKLPYLRDPLEPIVPIDFKEKRYDDNDVTMTGTASTTMVDDETLHSEPEAQFLEHHDAQYSTEIIMQPIVDAVAPEMVDSPDGINAVGMAYANDFYGKAAPQNSWMKFLVSEHDGMGDLGHFALMQPQTV